MEPQGVLTGTVKWYDIGKGWGFIETDMADQDVFVHFSVLQDQGYKALSVGQTVTFEVEKGDRGLHATDVCFL